jgi:predicted dehydrogenase
MNANDRVLGVGIVGAGFIAQTHCKAMASIPGCEVRAVADLDALRAEGFAADNGLPRWYASHRDLLADPGIDVVVVGIPNCFHAAVAIDCLAAGRHVICEKPLALTIPDAEAMIRVAREKGRVLAYAEELSFVPKFLRAKELMDSGGIGRPYLIRQCEKHAGPYSPWFWKEESAGGGILMDMGCHSIECIRFLLGKPAVKSVYAQMGTFLHREITQEEDHVIAILEFEDGTIGQAESSWALKGGMDSTLEIFGTGGVVYADLLKGMGLKAYSEEGFPGVEDRGWCFPDYEWLFNNGYPQEDRHFLDCMRSGETPVEAGEDGLAILEIMLAAYHSAGIGRKVRLPFRPRDVRVPVDLWIHPRPELGEGPIP